MIDIFDNEKFKELPEEQKTGILNNYFDTEIANEDFSELPTDDQDRMRNNFISENINIGKENDLANYPNLQQEETTFQYMQDAASEFIGDVKDTASSAIDYAAEKAEPVYDFAGDLVENKVNQLKLSTQIARRPVLGMAQLVGNLLGYESEIIKDISDNEQGIMKTAKAMGLTAEDLQKQEVMVEVISAFMPVDKVMKISRAFKNPVAKRVSEGLAVGGAEAIIAGSTQSGKEEETFSDKAQSASIVAGTIGAVAPVAFEKVILPAVGKVFNATDIAGQWVKEIVTAKASPDSSYDFLLGKVGATAKDAESWNNAYSLAIKKDVKNFTAEDKIAALLNNSDNGAALKKQAEYIGADGSMAREAKLEEMFKEMVFKETKDGSLEVPSLQLKKYLEDSGTIYGEVEDILKTHYNSKVKISPSKIKGLEDALTSSSMRADDVAVIKRIVADLNKATTDGLNVDKLLNMKHDLNSINLKSTKKWKSGQVGAFIDNAVKEGIGEEGFSVWKEVNQRYAAKSILQDKNPIAKLLKEGYEGNTNFKVVAEELLKIREGGGYKTFNQIRLALGDKVSSSLEKEMINVAFSNKENTFEAIRKLKDFDFSTTEGRGLIGELNRLEGLVPDTAAKELINKTLGMPTGSSVGWSDDILAKVRYGAIGQIFNKLTRRLPMNKVAKEERVFEQVASQLKKGEFKAEIRYIKDTEFNDAWKKQEKALTDRILELKSVGEARTSAQNKELASTISAKNKIDRFGLKPSSKVKKPKVGSSENTIQTQLTNPKASGTSGNILGVNPNPSKKKIKVGIAAGVATGASSQASSTDNNGKDFYDVKSYEVGDKPTDPDNPYDEKTEKGLYKQRALNILGYPLVEDGKLGGNSAAAQMLSDKYGDEVNVPDDNVDNNDRVFASGAYQIIPSTMVELLKKHTGKNISLDTLYTKKVQEQLGTALLYKKRPDLGAGLTKIKNGEKLTPADISKMKVNLANEWASFPDASGNSTSDKAGNEAKITPEEVDSVIESCVALKSDEPLREVIREIESNNRYGIANTGTAGDEANIDVSKLTIAQVLRRALNSKAKTVSGKSEKADEDTSSLLFNKYGGV